VLCLAKGIYTASTIRDHVINLAEGGQDTEDNVQALCQACSDAKTQREAERGRRGVDAAGTFRSGNRRLGKFSDIQKDGPTFG
jgi:5-methylcytosine-specific restriction endonuclease McrA